MEPLLILKDIGRDFLFGMERISVLKKINLQIYPGEFVAIMGTSGSGKSTLMNILGCLDRATTGSYFIEQRNVSTLTHDQLANLRRDYFGFIFQKYHLFPYLTALDNVEMPAIYAGFSKQERCERAQLLLEKMGLKEKLAYLPNQLSGGQQQRVSIARALMNGGKVILADEPTGALDSQNGQEILKLLHQLHQQGHTIVLVTHDATVAQHAERLIQLHDGEIIHDDKLIDNSIAPTNFSSKTNRTKYNSVLEAFKMAVVNICAHKLRSMLTMLGIIIGIMAVITVVAIAKGAQTNIISDINAIGTNVINIFPGKDWGDKDADQIFTLNASDSEALAKQGYVDSVTPKVGTNISIVQRKNISVEASAKGVGEQFFRVRGYELAAGHSFTAQDLRLNKQVVIIDFNSCKKFFSSPENAIGEILFIGNLPCLVIGVTKEKESMFDDPQNLNLWLPYTTVMTKILGTNYFSSIIVRIKDGLDNQMAEQDITRLLTFRHGNRKDFFTRSSDTILKTVKKTTSTMTLLISSIALISLLVGGIGVMNIMLVSVSERTHEIGIRMAVGAKKKEILQQFLIEAMLMCLIGGILGVLFSFGLGKVITLCMPSLTLQFSIGSIIVAVLCSSLVGVIFGYLPARNAARLSPIVALARE